MVTYPTNSYISFRYFAVDLEDVKRETLERKIDELKESIYLNDRDQEMIKMVRKSYTISLSSIILLTFSSIGLTWYLLT